MGRVERIHILLLRYNLALPASNGPTRSTRVGSPSSTIGTSSPITPSKNITCAVISSLYRRHFGDGIASSSSTPPGHSSDAAWWSEEAISAVAALSPDFLEATVATTCSLVNSSAIIKHQLYTEDSVTRDNEELISLVSFIFRDFRLCRDIRWCHVASRNSSFIRISRHKNEPIVTEEKFYFSKFSFEYLYRASPNARVGCKPPSTRPRMKRVSSSPGCRAVIRSISRAFSTP